MTLIAITPEVADGDNIQNSEFLRDLCASVIDMYPHGAPEPPWAGYLAEEDGIIVGTCAFKSPPTSGAVEIAYFTFPDHEGRGVATRMAQHLIKVAREHGITRVTAQTLPDTSASTRILEKLGFVLAGTISHPQDGDIWEWHLW
jgi:[ribosomal protein S5]-alanine N-acetyltransferase